MWDHTLNDWGWGLAVNLWGVIHGIKAFVPRMLDGGDEGHVVNTSSGNGGIAPLPSTAIYATTKAAVTTLTEVLYGQLRAVDSRIGVSVLFPGPEGAAHRSARVVAASGPRRGRTTCPATTPYTTIESFEARMRAAGIEPDYTPVEAVAEEAVRRHPRRPVLDPARQRANRRHHPGSRRRRCSNARHPPTWSD